MFDLNDVVNISDAGLEIISTDVTRSIRFEDRKLNLRLSQSEGGVDFRLNYHFPTSDAVTAADALVGKVAHFKEHSVDLLNRLYDVLLEENHD